MAYDQRMYALLTSLMVAANLPNSSGREQGQAMLDSGDNVVDASASSGVAQLYLYPESVWQSLIGRDVELTMESGEQVRGRLEEISGDTATIVTPEGDRINIARAEVTNIEMAPATGREAAEPARVTPSGGDEKARKGGKGTGLLVSGGVLLAVGIGLQGGWAWQECEFVFDPQSFKNVNQCSPTAGGVSLGITGLAVAATGIGLLAAGGVKRARHKSSPSSLVTRSQWTLIPAFDFETRVLSFAAVVMF
jgi:hypothetical protein